MTSLCRVERLQDWVTRRAASRPEAAAVVAGDGTLPYGRLDEVSDRLGRLLAEAGCRRGDRVALLAPKSAAAVAALLGVYKAGAVAVPLDPGSPAPRLARVLASSGSRALLAGGGTAALVRELRRSGALGPEVRLGWLGPGGGSDGREPSRDLRADLGGADFGGADFTGEDLARCPPGPLPRPAGADDPAHVLYTSGSTGEPKGVVVRHSSVIAFVDWAVRHFGITAGERLSGHSPLHFDLSTFDLFGAFAAGAAVHLVPPELALLPHRLADFIRRSRLTQWFSVPSLLAYLARFDVVRRGDFPELRRLLWCGEVFPTPALAYWMRRLPHVAFTNLYGPTETAIASSFYDVLGCPEDGRADVPIGRPCDGEELLVLDGALRPVEPGSAGELCIRGVGLSPGYFGEPAKTARAFLPDPSGAESSGRVYRTGDLARVGAHGLVHLLGRVDSQIKSRGYRIELGEIESAIAAVGLAEEAVVTAIPTGGFEGQSICCAYVPAPGREAGPGPLRRELTRLLPGYMLPARWMTHERLPRNANGKLDRARVKEMFVRAGRPEGAAAAAPRGGAGRGAGEEG